MYRKMMEDAKARGLTSEKMMWESVDELQDMLCALKMEHPHKYWRFIRKTHGVLYKGHYTEEFARYDVGKLQYTNRKGEKKEGEYWSVQQTKDAMKQFPIPSGVNEWDLYVAANVMHSDMCKDFDDEQILKATYAFFFHDEDWDDKDGSSTKVWTYMCCKHNK